jgi:hypothetical protein
MQVKCFPLLTSYHELANKTAHTHMQHTLPRHTSATPVIMPMQITRVLPLPTPAAVMVLAQWCIMKEPATSASVV